MFKQKRILVYYAMTILYCFVFSLFFTSHQLADNLLSRDNQENEANHFLSKVSAFNLSAVTQIEASGSTQGALSVFKNQLKNFIEGWRTLEFDLINKVACYLSYAKAALPYSPSVNIIYPFHSHL